MMQPTQHRLCVHDRTCPSRRGHCCPRPAHSGRAQFAHPVRFTTQNERSINRARPIDLQNGNALAPTGRRSSLLGRSGKPNLNGVAWSRCIHRLSCYSNGGNRLEPYILQSQWHNKTKLFKPYSGRQSSPRRCLGLVLRRSGQQTTPPRASRVTTNSADVVSFLRSDSPTTRVIFCT
jgi:hypothetical protein